MDVNEDDVAFDAFFRRIRWHVHEASDGRLQRLGTSRQR